MPDDRRNSCALLDRISLDHDLHTASAREAIAFFEWLKANEDYQILVGSRECDHGLQVEFFVSCSD
jgi:hypothetical protein